MKKASRTLTATIVFLIAAATAPADVISWANPVSGTWGSAVFWSPSQVPGPADFVTVGVTGQSYDVILDSHVSVASLALSSSDAILHSNGRNITVSGNSSVSGAFVNFYNAVWNSGGSFVNNGTINLINADVIGVGPFTNNNTVIMSTSGGSITVPLNNDGFFLVNGFNSFTNSIVNTGTLRLESFNDAAANTTTTLSLGAQDITNGSSIVLTTSGGGALATSVGISSSGGRLINGPGASLSAEAGVGGPRALNLGIDNQGLFGVSTNLSVAAVNGVHANSGVTSFLNGSLTLTSAESYTNTNAVGTVNGGLGFGGNASATSSWSNTGSVIVGGNLTISNFRTVTNSGTLSASGNMSVSTSALGAPLSLLNTGSMTVAPGQSASFAGLNYSSALTMGPGATLAGGGAINLTLMGLTVQDAYSPGASPLSLTDIIVGGAGSLNIADGSTLFMQRRNSIPGNMSRIATACSNAGDMTVQGFANEFTGAVTNQATGSLTLEAVDAMTSARIYLADNNLVNHGLMTLQDTVAGANTVEITLLSADDTGMLVNEPTGTINVEPGGTRNLLVSVDNQGDLNVNAATSMTRSAATYTNSGDLTVTAGPLTVQGFESFDNSGTFNLTGGAAAFTSNFSVTSNWSNSGTATLSGGNLSISNTRNVTNSGAINATGANFSASMSVVGVPMAFMNTGDIAVGPGQSAAFSGINYLSALTIGPGATLAGGGAINLTLMGLTVQDAYSPGTSPLSLVDIAVGGAGSLTIPNGSTLFMQRRNGVAGNLSRMGVPCSNAGAMTIQGFGNEFTGAVTNQATGSLTLEAAGTLTSAYIHLADNNLINHGLMTLQDTVAGANTVEISRVLPTHTGRLDNAPDGRIEVLRGGTRNLLVPVDNHGTFATETTAAAGNTYTQDAGGTLEIGLGGLTVGTQYGRLAVTGVCNLAGMLAVRLIDGFVPNPGDTFTVLTATTLNGDVGGITTIDFPPLLSAQATRVGATIVVKIGLDGDLNGDGAVDLLDVPLFVLALTDPGQCQPSTCFVGAADMNDSGTANGADVAIFTQLLTTP